MASRLPSRFIGKKPYGEARNKIARHDSAIASRVVTVKGRRVKKTPSKGLACLLTFLFYIYFFFNWRGKKVFLNIYWSWTGEHPTISPKAANGQSAGPINTSFLLRSRYGAIFWTCRLRLQQERERGGEIGNGREGKRTKKNSLRHRPGHHPFRSRSLKAGDSIHESFS